MSEEVLSPGVENAEEADLGSKVLWIGCDFQQSVGGGGEQQVVEACRVIECGGFSSWGTVNTTWK